MAGQVIPYKLGRGASRVNTWHHPVTSSPHEAQCSFHSELTALQAAAAWCAAAVDFWQLHMGSSPTHVTIAVDNAAALQVASGAGMARGTHTATTRWLWQCVQGRVSTEFRHVHSHQGTMVIRLRMRLLGWRTVGGTLLASLLRPDLACGFACQGGASPMDYPQSHACQWTTCADTSLLHECRTRGLGHGTTLLGSGSRYYRP